MITCARLCAYACIYVLFVHVHVCIRVNNLVVQRGQPHGGRCMITCARLCAYACIWVKCAVCVCMCVNTHACMHAYVYKGPKWLRSCVCMYMYAWIHLHTHTQTFIHTYIHNAHMCRCTKDPRPPCSLLACPRLAVESRLLDLRYVCNHTCTYIHTYPHTCIPVYIGGGKQAVGPEVCMQSQLYINTGIHRCILTITHTCISVYIGAVGSEVCMQLHMYMLQTYMLHVHTSYLCILVEKEYFVYSWSSITSVNECMTIQSSLWPWGTHVCSCMCVRAVYCMCTI